MIETSGFFEIRKEQRRNRSAVDRQTAPRKASFEGMLKSNVETERTDGTSGIFLDDQDIETLLEDIDNAGEELKRTTTWSNAERYKNLVSKFLRAALKKTTTIENNESVLPNVVRKRYSLIRAIDEQLQELVHAFIQDAANNLIILEKIGQIHGLIVDLQS